jgi:hypothetical protein
MGMLRSRKRLARTSTAIAGALLMVAGRAAPASADVNTFIALLNSGQEVPITDSDAIGVSHLTYDSKSKMLCFSISYLGLENGEDDETQAHFHGPAVAGQNGSVLFAISPGVAGLGSPKSGCVGPLEKDQKKALQKGQIYINIHTNDHPNGEIRGQVLPIKGS